MRLFDADKRDLVVLLPVLVMSVAKVELTPLPAPSLVDMGERSREGERAYGRDAPGWCFTARFVSGHWRMETSYNACMRISLLVLCVIIQRKFSPKRGVLLRPPSYYLSLIEVK